MNEEKWRVPFGHNYIFIAAQLFTLSLVLSLPLASSLNEDVKPVPVLPSAVSKRISHCFSLIMINPY